MPITAVSQVEVIRDGSEYAQRPTEKKVTQQLKNQTSKNNAFDSFNNSTTSIEKRNIKTLEKRMDFSDPSVYYLDKIIITLFKAGSTEHMIFRNSTDISMSDIHYIFSFIKKELFISEIITIEQIYREFVFAIRSIRKRIRHELTNWLCVQNDPILNSVVVFNINSHPIIFSQQCDTEAIQNIDDIKNNIMLSTKCRLVKINIADKTLIININKLGDLFTQYLYRRYPDILDILANKEKILTLFLLAANFINKKGAIKSKVKATNIYLAIEIVQQHLQKQEKIKSQIVQAPTTITKSKTTVSTRTAKTKPQTEISTRATKTKLKLAKSISTSISIKELEKSIIFFLGTDYNKKVEQFINNLMYTFRKNKILCNDFCQLSGITSNIAKGIDQRLKAKIKNKVKEALILFAPNTSSSKISIFDRKYNYESYNTGRFILNTVKSKLMTANRLEFNQLLENLLPQEKDNKLVPFIKTNTFKEKIVIFCDELASSENIASITHLIECLQNSQQFYEKFQLEIANIFCDVIDIEIQEMQAIIITDILNKDLKRYLGYFCDHEQVEELIQKLEDNRLKKLFLKESKITPDKVKNTRNLQYKLSEQSKKIQNNLISIVAEFNDEKNEQKIQQRLERNDFLTLNVLLQYNPIIRQDKLLLLVLGAPKVQEDLFEHFNQELIPNEDVNDLYTAYKNSMPATQIFINKKVCNILNNYRKLYFNEVY